MKQKRIEKPLGGKSRPATYPSAVRMARLVDEMPRHGLGRRLSSVAKSLGVTNQTIRRYVKALNEEFITDTGEPQFEIVRHGEEEEWLVRRSQYQDSSKANIYQLISVYLSLEIFKMLGANNLFADLIDNVLHEVEQKLTGAHRGLIKDLPCKFFSAPWAPKNYSSQDEILSDAIKAVVYQYQIEVAYKPVKGDARNYVLQPLTLLHHKGGLYLIARTLDHDTPVYYNIERIQELKVTTTKFDYPANYHPNQMLDGAFGIFTGPVKKFVLKFPPELADYIYSRQWHKSQKCNIQGDGSVILTMEVTDSEEIRSWMRGFGGSLIEL